MSSNSYLSEINDFIHEYSVNRTTNIPGKQEGILPLIDKLTSHLQKANRSTLKSKAIEGKLRYLSHILNDILKDPPKASNPATSTLNTTINTSLSNLQISEPEPPEKPVRRLNFKKNPNPSDDKVDKKAIETTEVNTIALNAMLLNLEKLLLFASTNSKDFLAGEMPQLVLQMIKEKIGLVYKKMNIIGSCKYKLWVPGSSIDIVFIPQDIEDNSIFSEVGFIVQFLEAIQKNLTTYSEFEDINLININSWVALKLKIPKLYQYNVTISLMKSQDAEANKISFFTSIQKVRDFLLLIKLWAKECDVTFSGYLMTWLGLFYLSYGPKVLPSFKNGAMVSDPNALTYKGDVFTLFHDFFNFYKIFNFQHTMIVLKNTMIEIRKDNLFPDDHMVILCLNGVKNIGNGVDGKMVNHFVNMCAVTASIKTSK